MLLHGTCARCHKSVRQYGPIKFNNRYLNFRFTDIHQGFKRGNVKTSVHRVIIGKVVPKTSIMHSSEFSKKRRQLLWAVDYVWSGVLSTTWLHMLGRWTGVEFACSCSLQLFRRKTKDMHTRLISTLNCLFVWLQVVDCPRVTSWYTVKLLQSAVMLLPKTVGVGSSMFGSTMCPRVADSVAIEKRVEGRKCHLSSSPQPLNLQLTYARIGHRCNQQRQNIVGGCVKCVHIVMKVRKPIAAALTGNVVVDVLNNLQRKKEMLKVQHT